MRVYPIDHIISYARERSPYYKKLYSHLGGNPCLEQLPLVDQADFWSAADRGEVNTGEHMDGQIFKSGGTTGAPKHALYTAEEWRTMCEAAGMYMPLGGLKPGDKIANLFYAGGLYASFLYSYGSFFFSPVEVLQYSLSGNMEISETAEIIERMKINIVAGLPSKIMNVLEYMTEQEMTAHIDVIYYAGETFYPDQRRRVHAVLGDKIEFRSMSYASNDAGFMAYFHKESCGFNEHRSSDMFCRLEIIDTETGEVIREAARPGQIFVTSLYKLLTPIIRYPAGDMGPLGYEKEGFASFVAPHLLSVPGLSVLMGDKAVLHEGSKCGCGISSPYMEITGRAGTSAAKSCAIAASELLKR